MIMNLFLLDSSLTSVLGASVPTSVRSLLILATAALIAGAINAIAGGGSLITFPALLAVGLPSVTANVTNTVALWPGTIGGSVAYKRELRCQSKRIWILGTVGFVGGLLGSFILLISPQSVFDLIVPFLILFACGLLLVQKRIAKWILTSRDSKGENLLSPGILLGQFLAAVYGGYFGAGLGIITLAILGLFLDDDLQRINALKGVLTLIINGIAALYFAVFGNVVWPLALLMAVCSWTGGFLGVRVARRLNPDVLRLLVVIYGIVVSIRLMLS